jgi:uncharacterized protein (DUF433 family)
MPAKSQPLTVRLAGPTYAYVADEAERSGRARGAVVAALAEEGLRARLLPGIAFRGDNPRRAWVAGTAHDVWQIVQGVQDLGSPERLIAESELEERSVRLALLYYERHPEEIDRLVAGNRRSVSELRQRYPTFELSGVGE